MNPRIAGTVHPTLQIGHPFLSMLRFFGLVFHSCAGFCEHFHQTFRAEAIVMSLGVSFPFFVGCHSLARIGETTASDLAEVKVHELQYGHPFPLLTRGCILASHSCSGFLEQRHQTFLALPQVTSSGVSFPFLEGCHSAASCGKSAASEFVPSAYCPAQNGQPFPRIARFLTEDSHSCDGLAKHRHQIFRDEPS
jgi:hypothetical protein